MVRRLTRRWLGCGAAGVVAVGTLLTAPAAQAAGHPAGVVGTARTLTANVTFASYDVAARRDGTAYVGWISSTTSDSHRKVHLCTVPPNKTTCSGGIQTIDALDTATAADLKVVVTSGDVVHLLWFHDTIRSIQGPQGAAIAEATAVHGQNLTAGQDIITDAPSFGQLLEAGTGPGDQIWTVSYQGVASRHLQVRDTLTGARVNVKTPFAVGHAQLAFSGTTPILAVEKYGAISTAAQYATRGATKKWSAFHAVAHTWTGAGATLETTRHGVRIVTGVDNASYRPVIAAWHRSGFGPRRLTVDRNPCGPSTHDGSADRSGRLLDVSWECNDVTIANYVDAQHAAVVRFHVSQTPTGTPQIASGTRGVATVVYSSQSTTAQSLRVVHVRLPGSVHSVRKAGTAGRVTVIGPRACLPPSSVRVGLSHRPAKGWRFTSGSLALSGHRLHSATLDGAKLTAGKAYRLTATAAFTRNGIKKTVRASLVFVSCAQA
jgi:hypothetical protein